MGLKKSRTECTGIKWSEFLTLVEQLKEKKDYKFLLIISVGCFCGLRIGDILKLRWENIVNKSSIEILEKKTCKLRVIALNANLQEIIQLCYLSFQLNGNGDISSYIFCNRWGSPFKIQWVNRRLHQIFAENNIITQGSSHTLRKTFGRHVYEMANKSESALILLSQIFKHSTISCTRRYIGLEQEQIQNVYLSL